MDSKYVRITSTVYVEMKDGEKATETIDRFLSALQDGMDVVHFNAEYWDEKE